MRCRLGVPSVSIVKLLHFITSSSMSQGGTATFSTKISPSKTLNWTPIAFTRPPGRIRAAHTGLSMVPSRLSRSCMTVQDSKYAYRLDTSETHPELEWRLFGPFEDCWAVLRSRTTYIRLRTYGWIGSLRRSSWNSISTGNWEVTDEHALKFRTAGKLSLWVSRELALSSARKRDTSRDIKAINSQISSRRTSPELPVLE